MTKKEIVNAIAEKTGIDRESVLLVVEEFMDEVRTALSSGESVYLRFFGTFMPKKRASKPARNIKSNTTIFIPERYVPYFKPSEYFKQDVIDGVKEQNEK